MARTRTKTIEGRLRLSHLNVRNYKGLDELNLQFPRPRMSYDPDLFALGSENGLGKTSILECCALLYLAPGMRQIFRNDQIAVGRLLDQPVNIEDLMIRSGQASAHLNGVFESETFDRLEISLEITRDKGFSVKGDWEEILRYYNDSANALLSNPETFVNLLLNTTGFESEPVIVGSLLYFHSYRKVQEGNPELGMMVEPAQLRTRKARYPRGVSVSTFKIEILRSLMGRGNLFENFNEEEANRSLDTLNELMRTFAGGQIEKLRPSANNTLEFRIQPSGPNASFSFDGLSSGQKEIISTLFLIWKYTHDTPGIVLIDEPEMHLNAEWHRAFVSHLSRLQPENQYIIATHSEDIFASVEPDRRILLRRNGEHW